MQDELFTITSMEINGKFGEDIVLIPLGDIHFGSDACDEKRLFQMLDWIASKKNTYVIGMGDYLDFARATDRAMITKNTADSTREIIDKYVRLHVDKFIEKLKPLQDKILGLGEGNHRWEFSSGISDTQYIADRLGTKYLGYMSFFNLKIDVLPKHAKLAIDILIHHGTSGGGRTAGASINRVDRLEQMAVADIYMMGHDHQKGVRPMCKFELHRAGPNVALRKRKQLLISTGSYLKSYMPNQRNYAVKPGYRPADLGCSKITLTPRRFRDGKVDLLSLDMHASV